MSIEVQEPVETKGAYTLHDSVVQRLDKDYVEFYNKNLKDKKPVHLLPVETARGGGGNLVPGAAEPRPVHETQDHVVHDGDVKIPIRIFKPFGGMPEGGWPLCVWYHGGGWVLGDEGTENNIASFLCSQARCIVITVGYRLAPEHPFPAALEDSWAAYKWAMDADASSSHLPINRTSYALGGSSAGGNITAALCQRIASDPSLHPPRLQLLSVPVLDNTASTHNNASWRDNEYAPGLPAAKMEWFRDHYLPRRADRRHPEASPLFWEGDWGALPAAVVMVGGLDVLCEEAWRFADKMRAAGAKVEVHEFSNLPHPFIAMDRALGDARRAQGIFGMALEQAFYF